MGSVFAGKCLCGSVTYEVVGTPVVVAQCHCEECRRLSGTGHTIGAMFASTDVTVKGELGAFKYVSGNGSEVSRCFCKNCGSPIYGTNSRTPEHLTLSLGTMDDVQDLEVQVVVFARDKQHWDQLSGDVMTFETQPDWKPDA